MFYLSELGHWILRLTDEGFVLADCNGDDIDIRRNLIGSFNS